MPRDSSSACWGWSTWTSPDARSLGRDSPPSPVTGAAAQAAANQCRTILHVGGDLPLIVTERRASTPPSRPSHWEQEVGRVRPAGLPELGQAGTPLGCSGVEPPLVGGGQARCSLPREESQAAPVLSVTVTMLRYAGRRAVIMER